MLALGLGAGALPPADTEGGGASPRAWALALAFLRGGMAALTAPSLDCGCGKGAADGNAIRDEDKYRENA